MLGVGEHKPLPPALKSMIGLLKNKLVPPLSVSQDRPKVRPDKFVCVTVSGGVEDDTGTIAEPVFVFQCYALNTDGAEELANQVLALCKSAQFTQLGFTQFRKWTTVSLPQEFPDPLVPEHRRWQFTGSLGISNRFK